MALSWSKIKRTGLLLALFLPQSSTGYGVTAAYYLDPLMTNSVDVIVEELASLPVGEATLARELSTNKTFRADDIIQYVFTNDFSSLGDYASITHRLQRCNRAAKLARWSCNLRNMETNLLLQAHFHKKLDTFLRTECLAAKAFESSEARWLADCVMKAKMTWPAYGLDAMYADLCFAITNGCNLSLANSLTTPERELVSALASSGLFDIRGINVPVISPTGNETNFVSVVATARQGQQRHLFLLDLANYANATPEKRAVIAANALKLLAVQELLIDHIKSSDRVSCHAISVFADTPDAPDASRALFKSPNFLVCNATNLPSRLQKTYFLSSDAPNWIDADQTFQILDTKSTLRWADIPDFIMEPSAHDFINGLMEESPEEIVRHLESFWHRLDRERLAAELSSNTIFRAEEILTAAFGREISSNSVEAAEALVRRNNTVSLVISWSCVTNYSEYAYKAESNYLARISALLNKLDCYGDSGARSPYSDLRRSANNAAFAYSALRHQDVLGELLFATSNEGINASGVAGIAPTCQLGEIENAMAELDGFSICATNVPYFNPFTTAQDAIDVILCQHGTRKKTIYLVNAKFYGKSAPPEKRTVIAEASKLESLCQGLVEHHWCHDGDTRTKYIPCLLFDASPELSPYRTTSGFLDSRCLILCGSVSDITNQLSRMRLFW